MMRMLHSWGRLRAVPVDLSEPRWRDQLDLSGGPALAWGLGRSYGDSCLLENGRMIAMRGLDRILGFCPRTGRLEAEAGISLDEILRFSVPRGWFLPTTPGTRQVTLGGAIANDVHGKNHHRAGCFGNHVPALELLRSDGSRTTVRECDPLLSATVGGLGLTGLITRAEVRLAPISSASLDVEYLRFRGIDEFMRLSDESAAEWEHTVAWIDCLASGSSLGRGIFMRGNWAAEGKLEPHRSSAVSIPFDFPNFALNSFSIRLFNALYYRRCPARNRSFRQHYSPFFHPLDAVGGWSRIYGRRGFHQYQCVTPSAAGAEPMKRILSLIAASGQGSFLAVLKSFGGIPSPGMLSFPQAGLTLALDFANRGEATLALFRRLDEVVRESGGRWYPAKDARMEAADFHRTFPRLAEFRHHLDPGLMSDFWKRMTA